MIPQKDGPDSGGFKSLLQQHSPQSAQRARPATLLASQPSTQQKRHNSQSYVLQKMSSKRGAFSTPSSKPQSRTKEHQTPTPTIVAVDVPGSPKSKVIGKLIEPDVSIENLSELNDAPVTRGSDPHSNSPESIPDKIPRNRRPSTDTVLSQPPVTLQQQPQRVITEEEHILASNLQETYKSILKLEIETQQGCAEVNERLIENDASVEITPQLWHVYKNIVQLLDHYYDFLLYALSPTSARAGRPLVTNYRILRRMWVYGVVSFLEVLKNVAAIFVDHEVCGCFIAYAFNIISCLTDAQLGVEGWWAEKLGDLSRMAIALYPARYMDWKISSVYWYQLAMRTQFGHGKIYYHMCTVESDNLEALVDIGKSVTCRDPFAPTLQYLRLIVDNVCAQRNILSSVEMAMIDFVKIHKILLMPNYNTNIEMANLVSHYSSHFGLDSSSIDYFQLRGDMSSALSSDKLNFWFQKGANFALCNINHLIGFGDCRNPFAKLFELPEALKQRKDKKDKRRKSKTETGEEMIRPADSEAIYNSTAAEQDENSWFTLLDFVNKGVIELSMNMLKQYLSGPLPSSTQHVIVWLYFIAAVGKATQKYPASKPLFSYILSRYIPWMKLVPYLNDILFIVRSSNETRAVIEAQSHQGDILDYYSGNEKLWEVWKCWGSIWFDQISMKTDYQSIFDTGVTGYIFDIPTAGLRYDPKQDTIRYLRIYHLGSYIADNFPEFGLVKAGSVFKYKLDQNVVHQEQSNASAGYFSQDARLLSLIEPLNPKISVDTQEDPWKAITTDELPSWEYNSHGFMTEYVNKQGLGSVSGSASDYSNFIGIDDLEDEEYEDSSADDSSDKPVAPYAPTRVSIVGNLGEKMDTAITNISLDTNAWLKHCGKIYKCVRSELFLLSIPLTVFQELRSLRRSADSSVADSATRAVIIVRQLYTDKQVVPIRADGTKASSLNETLEFEQNQNWRNNTDEIIMKAVKLNDDMSKSVLLGLDAAVNSGTHTLDRLEASVFRYNVLVTDDRNMAIRSKAIGLFTVTSAWLFEQLDKTANGRCTD
ncbi:hypothetical protein OGAPHI_005839 [Ogataea philodendri]|uniref:PIN domain-containing protein n=1 Tax=Ogataea philodendri TaxID=1378263 RepID=A0A9P8NZW5_9ASCO|nr:uncharacterized protein OGAPHI_005839 [Ogataea philodendri]KAH3662587.1 hypothetical protein OGAPHI_005839 [Ogataea philodendri]